MKELSYFEQQYNTAVTAKDRFLFKTGATFLIAALFWLFTLLSLPRVAAALIQLVFTGLVWFLCRTELTDGLKFLLKLSPSADSITAVALIAQGAHSVALLVSGEEPARCFGAVLFLSVALSQLMKFLFAAQVKANLDLIRDQKTNALSVADLTLSKQQINKICFVNPVVDFPNVVRASWEDDPFRKKNRRFLPFVLLGVILAAVLIGVIRKGTFFTALAALTVICASFAAEAAFVLPYILMETNLRKMGSFLLGNYSVEHLKDADTLLIRDTDLFPPERNQIAGFRIYGTGRHRQASEYTATLLHLIQSPVEDAFAKLIPVVSPRPKDVLQWRVIKNYGVVATVNSDNVLFGNRNLLLSHGVQPWSNDREAMLTAAGVHLNYLAVNGAIWATLVVRYGENPALKTSSELLSGDFHLLVETRDCCISESMIQRRYDLPRVKISVPDPEELDSVRETRTDLEEDSRTPVLLSTQSALGVLEPIRRAKRLDKTVDLCILTQQAATVFGLVLTAAALLIFPGAMHWAWLLTFHLIWFLPVAAVTFFNRK